MPFKCDIPAKPTQLQDDEAVRITRWDFEPGAVTGMHRHGWPYFVVMLTDGNLRAEVDGVVQDRPMTAGTSYARPAGVGVGLEREDPRGDAGPLSPRQAKGRTAIGHHHRDLRVQPTGRDRVDDGLQVATAAGDEDGQALGHGSLFGWWVCDDS